MVVNYQIYNSKGESIVFGSSSKVKPIRAVAGPAYVYQSVWNPVTFYTDSNAGDEKYDDWTHNEDIYMYSWNDIDGKKSGKSFFDPCPPGWKIPEKGTWDNFTLETNIEESWNSGPTIGWDMYMGTIGSSETVFVPIAGWRNLSSGEIGYNQSASTSNYMFTRLWVSKGGSNTSGYFMNVGRYSSDKDYAPNISPNSSNYRSYGNNVRCIQE